ENVHFRSSKNSAPVAVKTARAPARAARRYDRTGGTTAPCTTAPACPFIVSARRKHHVLTLHQCRERQNTIKAHSRCQRIFFYNPSSGRSRWPGYESDRFV